MDTREHAQQIYSMLLAAVVASGKPAPSRQEGEGYAEMAWNYAEAFRRVAIKKDGVEHI